jgi:hypothetical protein
MALMGKNLPIDLNKNEQYTPQWIFDKLSVRFDLDVASAGLGMDNVPADNRFTKSDDGLSQEWYGFVWMNPPYSAAKPWIDKWINHNNGIALIPFSKSGWFDDLWALDANCVALPSSLRFMTPSGKSKTIFMPCGLWAIGNKAKYILAQSKIGQVR